jgi:hypothetical protein
MLRNPSKSGRRRDLRRDSICEDFGMMGLGSRAHQPETTTKTLQQRDSRC